MNVEVTFCNNLYGVAPPERGTVFKILLQKRVEIWKVEISERVAIYKELCHLVLLKSVQLNCFEQLRRMALLFNLVGI